MYLVYSSLPSLHWKILASLSFTFAPTNQCVLPFFSLEKLSKFYYKSNGGEFVCFRQWFPSHFDGMDIKLGPTLAHPLPCCSTCCEVFLVHQTRSGSSYSRKRDVVPILDSDFFFPYIVFCQCLNSCTTTSYEVECLWDHQVGFRKGLVLAASLLCDKL